MCRIKITFLFAFIWVTLCPRSWSIWTFKLWSLEKDQRAAVRGRSISSSTPFQTWCHSSGSSCVLSFSKLNLHQKPLLWLQVFSGSTSFPLCLSLGWGGGGVVVSSLVGSRCLQLCLLLLHQNLYAWTIRVHSLSCWDSEPCNSFLSNYFWALFSNPQRVTTHIAQVTLKGTQGILKTIRITM